MWIWKWNKPFLLPGSLGLHFTTTAKSKLRPPVHCPTLKSFSIPFHVSWSMIFLLVLRYLNSLLSSLHLEFVFHWFILFLPTLEPPNSLFWNTINSVIEESGEKAIHYVKILFSGYLFLTWSNCILDDKRKHSLPCVKIHAENLEHSACCSFQLLHKKMTSI